MSFGVKHAAIMEQKTVNLIPANNFGNHEQGNVDFQAMIGMT